MSTPATHEPTMRVFLLGDDAFGVRLTSRGKPDIWLRAAGARIALWDASITWPIPCGAVRFVRRALTAVLAAQEGSACRAVRVRCKPDGYLPIVLPVTAVYNGRNVHDSQGGLTRLSDWFGQLIPVPVRSSLFGFFVPTSGVQSITDWAAAAGAGGGFCALCNDTQPAEDCSTVDLHSL